MLTILLFSRKVEPDRKLRALNQLPGLGLGHRQGDS